MNGTMVNHATPNANTGNNFPWAGQPDETACNYAFGLMIRNLPQRVAIEDKMHAPTLMAAAGAVAGVCAQISLLSDAARMEKAKADGRVHEAKLKSDGRIFLYGDALNDMLYSTHDQTEARMRVWNMMVTAALQKGLARDAVPKVRDMFAYVTSSLGTNNEGRPSVAANAQPIAPVRQLLHLVGPVAFASLAGEIEPVPGSAAAGLRANRRSWVGVSAQVTANLLMTASRVLPLELCLTIAMESAIYASKMRANAPDVAPAQPVQA